MIDESAEAIESADARTIVDALWSSWPLVATLRPADLGMDESAERLIDFIKAFQDLGDAGMIIFEAFVVGPAGPQVIDAALTARGRALLGARMQPGPGAVSQLAR